MPPADKTIAIMWFNHDLRINDNSALQFALKEYDIVIPIYIHDDTGAFFKPLGKASKWWLHQSLLSLEKTLSKQGLKLLIDNGNSLKVLEKIIKHTKAECVTWNYSGDKFNPRFKHEVLKTLEKFECDDQIFFDKFLYHPDSIYPKNSNFYKVFGAFWRSCEKSPHPDKPKKTIFKNIIQYSLPSFSLSVYDLDLLPKKSDWIETFNKQWTPGEDFTRTKLDNFCKNTMYFYNQQRDFPCLDSTSQLSAHMHFGEISTRTVWHQMHIHLQNCNNQTHSENINAFIRQIGWNEFYHHLLYHLPHLEHEGLNPLFNKFEWNTDNSEELLSKWQKGETGIPIIDAGMRQLLQTGWMHNRVRMISASFLVKQLRIHWQKGEEWFWGNLVDADLANNSGGWQWVAGCGADAAPYFRIFNPILQSHKYDSQGTYIRRWIPELSELSNKYIHEPWEAPQNTLKSSGIILGKDYPFPIIDIKIARDNALNAYHNLKK